MIPPRHPCPNGCDLHDTDPTPETERVFLELMLDASIDCITIIGLDGRLLRLNRSGRLAFGLPLDRGPLGMFWPGLLPPELLATAERALRVAAGGKPAKFPGRSKLPGQKVVHWDNLLTPIRDAGGTVLAVLCVSRDITRQMEAERKLRLASDCDPLTGLANLRLLRRQSASLLRTASGRAACALLAIDVDDFKAINDGSGHDAGDHVLHTLGRRLRRCCRAHELPARIGGDEFAVLIDGRGMKGPEEAARRVLKALSRPITYRGREHRIRVSIGAASAVPGCGDLASLMKQADLALYAVKSRGKNDWALAPGLVRVQAKDARPASAAPAGRDRAVGSREREETRASEVVRSASG